MCTICRLCNRNRNSDDFAHIKIDEATRSQSNIFPEFRIGVYRERKREWNRKWMRKFSSRAPTLHHVMRKSAHFIYLTTETQTVAKTIVSRKNIFYLIFFRFYLFRFIQFFLEFFNALNLILSHTSLRFSILCRKCSLKIVFSKNMNYSDELRSANTNTDVIIPTAHEILNQQHRCSNAFDLIHKVLIFYLTICECVCTSCSWKKPTRKRKETRTEDCMSFAFSFLPLSSTSLHFGGAIGSTGKMHSTFYRVYHSIRSPLNRIYCEREGATNSKTSNMYWKAGFVCVSVFVNCVWMLVVACRCLRVFWTEYWIDESISNRGTNSHTVLLPHRENWSAETKRFIWHIHSATMLKGKKHFMKSNRAIHVPSQIDGINGIARAMMCTCVLFKHSRFYSAFQQTWMWWRMKWMSECVRSWASWQCHIATFIVHRFSHYVRNKKKKTVIPIHSHEPLRKWRENLCDIKATRWIQEPDETYAHRGPYTHTQTHGW